MTAETVAGLKPYPAYKPSGVEWLGEVPAHWEVRRLKYVVTLVMGQSPPGETCSDKPIGLPFLQGCAEFGERHPSPTQFCYTPQKESPIGAILLSVRAPVGRLNIADQAYGIGRGLCAISTHKKFLQTKFAYYQLEVLGYGLRLASTGSTYDAVSVGDVGNQPSILPPLAEQTAIVRYLDHADRLIHRYISAKQRLIGLLDEKRQASHTAPLSVAGLLGEYRTRLITDVVTGKLDVREAAERLPDVDPAPTDETEPSINAVAETGREAIPDLQAATHRDEVPGIQRPEDHGVRARRRTSGRPT